MYSEETLIDAAHAFFTAFSSPTASKLELLSYFSTTAPVFVQHTHISCPHPQTSRLCGLNAVRSYFDILNTHWIRTHTSIRSPTPTPRPMSMSFDSTPALADPDPDHHARSAHPSASPTSPSSISPSTSTSSTTPSPFFVKSTNVLTRSVTLDATSTWQWRKSGHTWIEDYTLTIHFDEALQLTRFEVVTVSGPETCVLRAVDSSAMGSVGMGGVRSRALTSPAAAGGGGTEGSSMGPAVVVNGGFRRSSDASALGGTGTTSLSDSKPAFGRGGAGARPEWTRPPGTAFFV